MMNKTSIALLRIPAFLIDFALLVGAIIGINKLGVYLGIFSGYFEIVVLMFICIPLAFFLYWLANINLGKRLFRLKIVDSNTGKAPTIFQYFKRCLLFTLLISFNIVFLIPILATKRNQGFHDMLANTIVAPKRGHAAETGACKCEFTS
jgi:uncharacterized RDD family membrane protein YckC